MARSTARKRALNTLYEADEKSQDILSLLDERIAHPGAQTPLPDYAIEIVKGVAEHRRQIDMTLDEHSTGWKVRRMGVVDRNILRIAAWEILFTDDVPDKVDIDEALALAKTLCDDDSPAFIHGLLSAVLHRQECSTGTESVVKRPMRIVDSAAAASEPTDEGDVSDSPVSSGHPTSLLPSLRFGRRSISHLLFSLPFGRLFHGRHFVPPYIQVGTCRQPRQRGRLCVQRRVSLQLAVNLGTNTRKHKGVLVSQNESGTIAPRCMTRTMQSSFWKT